LAACPNVDLAVVTVKVPHHFELVKAAVDGDKAIYCEWPLGNGLKEAEELAAMAKSKGLYNAVGLQARSAPVIKYAKALVAEGYVGEVLSSSIVADAINWGPDVLACYSYLLDHKNGASMLTIPFGHTMDAFCWVLGEFSHLNATMETRRKQIPVVETGEVLESTVADQIALSGTLQNGAVASVHFRGGFSKGTHFLWEINGTEGDLVITADGGHIQMLPLSIKGARGDDQQLKDLEIPPEYLYPLTMEDGPAASVARAYSTLVADWRTGEQTLPSFDDAVVRHRMLDAIERAAQTGERQSYGFS
jgi:predicted dehydrogenase